MNQRHPRRAGTHSLDILYTPHGAAQRSERAYKVPRVYFSPLPSLVFKYLQYTYVSEAVGGIGTLGCFSFHPRKVITTGEGGCVTTNNADLAASIVSLRNHGATGLPLTAPEARRQLSIGACHT